MAKTLHWTQKPENKARLRKMRTISNARKTAPPSRRTAGREQLIKYARIGAQVTVERCRAESVTAQMFLNSFKEKD